MTKYVLLITLCILFVLPGWCQVDNEFIIDQNTNPGLVLDEARLPPPLLEGTFYINLEWLKGNAFLYSKYLLKDYPMRYDLEQHLLEVKASNSIKVISPEKLRKFEWVDPASGQLVEYINCNEFRYPDNVPLVGFFELIIDQGVKLCALDMVVIKEATYLATVDMGSRNDKIVRERDYYVIIDNMAHRLSKSKKKNLPLFDPHSVQIDQFSKDHKLKFRKKEDLVKLIQYFNEII